MLRLIRRMLDSKVGVILALAFVVFVGLAFALTDVSRQVSGFGSSVGGGGDVLQVGKAEVGESDLRDRVQSGYRAASARQPELTLTSFVAGGGFETVVERTLNLLGIEQFGLANGLRVSKKLVDGEIASEPSFRGASGTFDEATFRRLLAENQLSEAEVRNDIRAGLMARQLLVPVGLNPFVPPSIARTYATLSLESRSGQVAAIPADAMPRGAAPSDNEIAAFYRANLSRYTVPERRVVRIARFGTDTIAAKATPSEAELAAAYRQNAAQYTATELRDLTQVSFFDQTAAQAFYQAVSGGQSMAAAARAAGLQPVTIENQDRAAYARSNGAALAQAAFSAPEGRVLPPVRSQGSFTVVRVDNVTQRPARSLDQVRDELTAQLTQARSAQLLSELSDRLYDRIDNGESLPDIARAEGLELTTTPPITAAGVNPDAPGGQPVLPPQVSQRVSVLGSNDDPTIETIAPDEQFYIADVERVLPAAPRPLAQIRERVAADLVAERQAAQAKRVADDVIARVARGQSLAEALRATGLNLPPVQPVSVRRQDLEAAQGPVPAPLRLLFAMAPGSAKRIAAPDGAGYGVVVLSKVTPGDVTKAAELVRARGQALAESWADEYQAQFALGARQAVGVERDDAALNRIRGELTGAQAAQ